MWCFLLHRTRCRHHGQRPLLKSERGYNMATSTNNSSADELKEQQHKVTKKEAEIEKNQPSGCLVFGMVFLGVVWLFSEIGAAADGAFIWVVIIAVFAIVMMIRHSTKQEQLDALKANIKKEQALKRSEMEQVFESAKQNSFSSTTTVTDPNGKYCIAADDNSKRFLVKSETGTKYRIYNYADLIDYELSQDGASTISSRAGDALVGGILLGTTGAVVGASKSRDIQEYCSSLYVSLTVNDSSNIRIQIPFISGKVLKTSSEFTYAVERAKEMIALLQFIQTGGNRAQLVQVLKKKLDVDKQQTSLDPTAIEAVKQYKELLEAGLISQEEYEMKRKELLKI